MRKATEEKALHVQDVLGPGYTVLEFEETTATSEQAAAAIGCTVAQIAKSVLFKTKEGDPVLVVASGPNRVDDKKVRDLLGQKVKSAQPDYVLEKSGYVIGGVSPVGHVVKPVAFIDVDLMQFDTVWASAGTPNAVFELKPQDLPALTGGTVGDVAKR